MIDEFNLILRRFNHIPSFVETIELLCYLCCFHNILKFVFFLYIIHLKKVVELSPSWNILATSTIQRKNLFSEQLFKETECIHSSIPSLFTNCGIPVISSWSRWLVIGHGRLSWLFKSCIWIWLFSYSKLLLNTFWSPF